MFKFKDVENKVDMSLTKKELYDLVECKKCKCVVFKKDENKGKPEIKERGGGMCWTGVDLVAVPYEQYIENTYYCGRCMPKKKVGVK